MSVQQPQGLASRGLTRCERGAYGIGGLMATAAAVGPLGALAGCGALVWCYPTVGTWETLLSMAAAAGLAALLGVASLTAVTMFAICVQRRPPPQMAWLVVVVLAAATGQTAALALSMREPTSGCLWELEMSTVRQPASRGA